MDLEWSAVTLAGHMMIVLALWYALVNAAAAHQSWPGQRDHSRMEMLRPPAFAAGASLCVERLYYVAARMLVNSDIDLWDAHPAPDVLSIMVGVPLLWLAVNIRRLSGPLDERCQRIVLIQITFAFVVFGAASWGLW